MVYVQVRERAAGVPGVPLEGPALGLTLDSSWQQVKNHQGHTRGAKLTGFWARDGGAEVRAAISGTEALVGVSDPLLNTPFTHLEGTQEVSKSELSINLA